MSRVDIPEKERRDFYLYIDEFQNFSTESFATILSEARKYHLNLIIAHQYMEQLTDEVKAAVFGNVGTLVAFRVGAVDAEELVKEFAPIFEEEDILNLPKYEFYIKLMIDGVASSPFSARGLPPLSEEERTNNLQKAIDWTRQTYAKPQSEVEEEIMRIHFTEEPIKPTAPATPVTPGRVISSPADFSEPKAPPPEPTHVLRPNFIPRFVTTTAPKPAVPEKREAPKPLVNFFDAKCANCGSDTKVPFKPDNTRPVYCKNCLSELKKKKREDVMGRPLAKSGRPDFSHISPSALMATGAVEGGEKEEGYVSLAKLKQSGLPSIAQAKGGSSPVLPAKDSTKDVPVVSAPIKAALPNYKSAPRVIENQPPQSLQRASTPPATEKDSDKDLAEGEDIVFE